jgi:3-dehydroquinate synthase
MDRLLNREHEALVHAIERSCRNKAEIVAMDERETGIRAILNLGHTFGHAIETGLGYQDWLHGEAVAVGMLMSADLSCRLGWISRENVERISQLLSRVHLPARLPEGLSAERMLELMSVDKKARDGVMYLVLLKGIGNAVVTDQYDHDKLEATLKQFFSMQEIA